MENKGIYELVDIREFSVEIKVEFVELELVILGVEIVVGVVLVISMELLEFRSQDLDEELGSIVVGEIVEVDVVIGKGDEILFINVKIEVFFESMLFLLYGLNFIEDFLEVEIQYKFEMLDLLKEELGIIFGSQIKDVLGEDEEEDGVSEVVSLEEFKEED